jgi:cyclophilin family peptidyl-prolyl cis-trans isomerase
MPKYLLLGLIFLAACTNKQPGINQFTDKGLVTIYELQDQRNTPALLPYLKAKKLNHRVAANLAFASIQDTTAIPYLNQTLQIDQDELPRRAAAFALGQIGHPKALKILRPAFDAEFSQENQKVILEAIGKCGDSSTLNLFEKVEYSDSLLRLGWTYGVFRLSLKGYTSPILTERMFTMINHANGIEQELASHYLYRLSRGDSSIAKAYLALKGTMPPNIEKRIALLEEKPIERKWSFEDLWKQKWESTTNPYHKIDLIENLDNGKPTLESFLYELAFDTSQHYILRNTAFEKLMSINPSKKWNYVLQAIKSNDMALQSLACYEIHPLKPKYPTRFKELQTELLSASKQAQSELVLPLQSETYIDLGKAIEVLGGDKFEGYVPEFTRPIDWEFVKTIPQGQQVTIVTNKGTITLQTFVNQAPGTVANFLALVDSGFYKGKYFHRVVPQFVIQGGCARGDGWGGLNWNQRSEFSNYLNYKAGAVGVASAGKDTEGVQFFITHCPTPHLDGRYTIFAQVIDGMGVVNKIEVGDTIIRVERNANPMEVDEDC